MPMTIYPSRSEPNAEAPPLAAYQAREPMIPPMIGLPVEATQVGDYFALVMRCYRLLAWAALGGCLAGLMLTLVQSPTYRTKTSIEIQNINGDFLNMKQVHPVADEAQGSDALMDLQTQIEVLQSSSLSELAKNALMQTGLKQEWAAHSSSFGDLLHTKESVVTAKILDQVADSVKVRPVGQTRIIQIQVDAPNPMLAADFANTLVTEYIHQNIRARSQMTEAAEDWTRSQLGDMRHKLETSEQALQEYAARNGLVFTADRQTISDDRLRQVQTDLLHARTDLVDKEARRQLADASKADSLADVEKDTDLRELRAKLVDLRRQQAELLAIYKPSYGEVLKVKAQANEIERALVQARARVVGRVEDEYKESVDKERMQSAAYQDALAKAANESQKAIQYDILKREADANLTAYEDMLTKVKELNLAAAFRTSNVRIVDPAEPPARQHTPQLPLNVALGLFSSLTLAVGYVLIVERSNPNLRHAGEATARLGIPELAAIPTLGARFSELMPMSWPKHDEESDETGLAVIDDMRMDDDVLMADAFRTLVTSIMFTGHESDTPRVIVITSTAPQDGKTTVSCNLAIALARAGKRVLLIDGDMRRPSLHRSFSIPNMIGLGNLLQSGCTAADAHFAILKTAIRRVSVLPSGSFTAAPADLLLQPNLRTLLASYRQQFDMIIVDAPPLMGLPDARLLGRAADGVVLVARANKTPRSAILTACHRLGLDRSQVIGLVLNDCDGRDFTYPA